MPIAAEPPLAAAPLPAALPSVSDALVSEKAPPALTFAARYALEVDLWMFTPTAAATLIGPWLLSADGVAPASLSPAPSFAVESPSAKPRSPATCEFTSVPEL